VKLKTAALGALVALLFGVGATACGSSSPSKIKSAAGETTTSISSDAAGPSTGGQSQAAGATTTTLKAGAGAKAGGATTTVAPPGGNTSPTTAAPSTPQTMPPGDFPSTATFDNKCVNPAGSQRIHVQTVPNASVAYLVVYSDGKNHGGSHGGIADGSGKFSESFKVAPDAPKGQATGYAVSSDSQGKRSTATATFNVGGC
jgi:hypothetical protein